MLTKEQIKSIKWYRQSGAGIPLCIGLAMQPLSGRMLRKSGFYFPNDIAFFSKEESGYIFYHYFDYFLTLKEMDKLFSYLDSGESHFMNLKNDFYAAGEKMEAAGLSLLETNVDSGEFKRRYREFVELTLQFWENSLFMDLLDPFEEKIIEYIFENARKSIDRTQLSALMNPSNLSNFQNEQRELFEIYQKAKPLGISKEIEGLIEEHSKKYYWLKNDYQTVEYLGKEYYLLELKKLLNNPKEAENILHNIEKFNALQQEKADIIKELGLDARVQEKLNFFNWLITYRDDRKKYNQISNYFIIEVIKKISDEMGIDYELLKWAMPNEIEGIIGQNHETMKKLEIRKKLGIMIVFANGSGESEVITGLDTREYLEIIEKTIEASEIRGTTASLGKVIGTVKVILNQDDFSKMEKGDVIVASMTRPEYVPIMKIASAIITDEGGITCHAAIVSREFGIPCLTGTQVATRMLKDGDLIDVDANHGVVKIIKSVAKP